jgi:hypothetical protein
MMADSPWSQDAFLGALGDASPFLARRLARRIADYGIHLDGTGLAHRPPRAG